MAFSQFGPRNVADTLFPSPNDDAELPAVAPRLLAEGFKLTGVLVDIGGEFALSYGSGLSWNIASGDAKLATVRFVKNSGSVSVAADGTNPRWCLLVYDTVSGAFESKSGTPSATNPVIPEPDADQVALWAVYVPAGATSFPVSGYGGAALNHALDMRVFVRDANAVVGRIGSLTVLGHSYVVGTTQSDSGTSNPWQESAIARLQALLGIQEQNVLNLGNAGSNMVGAVRTFAGWRAVLQFVMPSNSAVVNAASDIVTAGSPIAVGGAGLIVYGVSDMFSSMRGVIPDDEHVARMDRTSAAHGFRTSISRLRAGVVYCAQSVAGTITWPSVVAGQAGSSGIVFTGGWADVASVVQNSGAGYKSTSTLGDSFTITLPQNFTGGVVTVCMIAPGAFVTHLNGSMTNGQTTMTVFDRREAATSGTIVLKIIETDGTFEEVLATLDADLVWNITRGVNGTTAIPHADLAVVTSTLPPDDTAFETTHRVAWTGTASGVRSDSGTANAAVSTVLGPPGTLTDTREAWTVDEWVGARVTCNGKWMIVASNTSTTLTGTTAWVGGDPGDANAWTMAYTTPIGGQGNAQAVFAPAIGIIPISVVARFVCTPADSGKTIIGTYENEISGDTTASLFFDSWWIESNEPPPCVLTNVHDWGFGASFWASTISQPYIVPFNQMLEDVVAEFDDWVRIADVYTPYWKRNGVLSTALANEATSTGVVFTANDPSFTPTIGQVFMAGGMYQAGPATQESMLVTAVAGSYPTWTLSLTRGVNGTTIRTHGDSGTANAAVSTVDSTPGTLTDTREAWTVNQWVGHVAICNGKTMVIASNTATVLTGRAAWVGGDPGDGNAWVIGEWMGPTDWMALDLLHINNKGHAVYAEMAYREFASMPVPAEHQMASGQGNWSQYSQVWHMGMVDDWYLALPALAKTTGTLVEDRQYAAPIWISRTCILTEIGLTINTAGGGSANSVIRFGIYQSDPSRGRPGPLLQDFGTVVSTGTGETKKTGCYQLLRPGWYWLSCCPQDSSGGTQPTVRTISVGLPYPSLMSAVEPAATIAPIGYQHPITADAAFTNWDAVFNNLASGEMPHMYIRVRTTMFG